MALSTPPAGNAEQAQQAERKLREEERVRQRQRELTDALRVSTVGELVSGLAPELSQPLSSISNLAVACSQRAGNIDTAKVVKLLTDIDEESVRAAGIVAHLRRFVEKGKAQLDPVDLCKIVGHVPHLLIRELERAQPLDSRSAPRPYLDGSSIGWRAGNRPGATADAEAERRVLAV